MERFRYASPGFPFAIPMVPSSQMEHQKHITKMASSPVSSTSSPSPGYNPRVGPPLGIPTFGFSREELDMVLYGYTKEKTDKCKGHALSGIKSADLSHGKPFITIISAKRNCKNTSIMAQNLQFDKHHFVN